MLFLTANFRTLPFIHSIPKLTVLLRFFLILCFLFQFFYGPAQVAKQYSFTHYTTVEGLASNSVNAVVQDTYGYIWIATANGLQRYDGINFITFKKESRDYYVPHNEIKDLYKDKHDNIWVSFGDNRVGLLNTKTLQFRLVQYPISDIEGSYKPKYFLEAADGRFFLHERHGNLYQFNSLSCSFSSSSDFFPSPKNWRFYQINWDRHSQKYWASSDSGFIAFNPVTKRISYSGHNVDKDPTIDVLGKTPASVFHILADGVFSFATKPTVTQLITHNYNQLHKFDPKSGLYQKYNLGKEINLGYHEVVGFLEQQNRFWVFGAPFLTEWQKGSPVFIPVSVDYQNQQSLKFDYSRSLYEDREKNIWFSTDNGLYCFNPDAQYFNVYNLIKGATKISGLIYVNAVLETQDRIYFGTWRKGLVGYDKDFNPVSIPSALQAYPEDKPIWDLHKHSRTGDIWIAQFASGLWVYNEQTEKTTKLLLPALFGERSVLQIAEDKNGNLWLGSHQGKLVKWNYRPDDNAIEKNLQLIHSFGRIRKIVCDKEGYIWLATEGTGVVKIDPVTNKIVRSFLHNAGDADARLVSSNINDILQYNDTAFIVVAGTIDIINTKTNKVRHITSADGLPVQSAYSGIVDNNGIVWLGTLDGLCRANIAKKIFTIYNRDDGIEYDNFYDGLGYKLSDGRIVYGTAQNFFVFDPNQVVQKNIKYLPQLTSLKVGAQSLSKDSLSKVGVLTLPYDKNSIQLTFSSLTYLQRKKLRYYYMLENLDKDWVSANELNQATYTYLPPGTYTFKLKVENADGLSSTVITTFPIMIRPPFWKTWWFISILILVVIGLILLIDNERIRRLKAMQAMRLQIAEDLHEEVNTTLNNINILSEMAKMKVDKDIDRSKEYIAQISEKSHNMINAMGDMLWSIDPENDSMKETVLRLQEFIEALQRKHAITIYLNTDPKVNTIQIDMKVRHELLLLLKMALRVVVEDCKGQHAKVVINYIKSKLVVKINDDYAAVASSPAIKKRLDEIEKRAAEIGAHIAWEADQNIVSALLSLPL